MTFNKSLIFSLIFSSFAMNGLFAIDATSKLFRAISENSFIAAKEAIAEGANLSAINPFTDKSVLYEAVNNYYKQAQKSFGLRMTAGVALGLSTAAGLPMAAIAVYGTKKGIKKGIKTGTFSLKVALPQMAITLGIFLALAAAATGSAKYIQSGIHVRNKIRRALSIVGLVYKEMMNNNIKPDQESLDLIKNLTPQLEKALNSQK